MTLIVSAVGYGDVRQVTDRLVSRGGVPFDYLANKNIVLFTTDAVVTMAYTGTAFIGQLPTDEWLVEACIGDQIPRFTDGRPVNQFGGVRLFQSLGRTIAALRDALDEAFTSAAVVKSAMSVPFEVMIAGWLWGTKKRARPILWSLLRNGTSSGVQVACAPRHVGRHWLSRITPPGNAEHADRASLGNDLNKCRSRGSVAQALMRAVRRAHAALPNYIGSDIMSIHIPPPGAATVRVRFVPFLGRPARIQDVDQAVAFTPWIVGPGLLSPPQIIMGSQTLQLGGWRIEFAAPTSRGGRLIGGAFPQHRPLQP